MVPVVAQGSLKVLQTGGGTPLVQSIEQIPGFGTAIRLNVGFATDETVSPGVFLDSFTMVVGNASAGYAVLATFDASGAFWAPPSTGALPLSDSQVKRQVIAAPAVAPIGGRGAAYSIEVTLPLELQGESLTAQFNLADNLDSKISLGWYEGLQFVSVPEPGSVLIFGLGLAFITQFKRRIT